MLTQLIFLTAISAAVSCATATSAAASRTAPTSRAAAASSTTAATAATTCCAFAGQSNDTMTPRYRIKFHLCRCQCFKVLRDTFSQSTEVIPGSLRLSIMRWGQIRSTAFSLTSTRLLSFCQSHRLLFRSSLELFSSRLDTVGFSLSTILMKNLWNALSMRALLPSPA